MVGRINHLTAGNAVLLFGPQALSFDQAAFAQLQSTIRETSAHGWILDVIAELPVIWTNLVHKWPKLQAIDGGKQLQDLGKWFRTGNIPKTVFPLPNILLSPLVVIVQLIQYAQYVDEVGSHHKFENAETLGFCTGLLSALTASLSTDNADFGKYGAVAVRLAMLIGGVVDAQDILGEHASSKSLAAVWNSAEASLELNRILEQYPTAYISVCYDQRRATVTTSTKSLPQLQQSLRNAGIIASEVGLSGRFHCECYRNDIDALIALCDSLPGFQFPDASELLLPTRSNAGSGLISQGKLHHHALRLILLEQSQWYPTFEPVYASLVKDKSSCLVSFGPERCVPPSMMKELSLQVIHVSDLSSFHHSANVPTSATFIRDNDIAVVGVACKVAGADDLEELWSVLLQGESQHREVPAERLSFDTVFRDKDPKRKWFGNFIRDHDSFDHRFFKKSPREIASTDPQQRHILQIAYQAVEQSGYFNKQQQDKKIGCYIGVCAADYENNIACHAPNAFSATGNLKSFIAGKISHYFGWTGPGLTIDSACSSSAVAIHQACRSILSGECTAALAGGTNIITSPLWFQNLAGASFLSPTGQCKPFDIKADGYCRGEAVAAVFLKKLSTAVADGDQILATIAGSAVTQNQNCTPIFVPNAPSLTDLFQNVMKQAHLEPEQVTVVEAHGTGTTIGDPSEYESILNVLGGSKRSTSLQLGSIKGLIGHTEAVSGVVSLVKILLMIREGAIPPQASFSTINPSIKHIPEHHIEITTKALPWDEDYPAALINNYGASGSNASMVIVQAPSCDPSSSIDSLEGAKHPFWFCGLDDRSLRAYATRFLQFLQSQTFSSKNRSIASLAFNLSRQSNRSFDRALMFSCSSIAELEQKLHAFESNDGSVTSLTRPAKRPIILCFGGQISTFIGLDRNIYDHVAILRSYLDQCDAICHFLQAGSIYPGIFERKPIEDPVKLQCILFASQYACAKSWIDCGVEPAAVLGHSFGELTALCVAGVLTLEDALKMVIGRSKIIRDGWGAERGAMMAVEGDLDQVERLLSLAASATTNDGERPATIACYNGPRSFTLAGSTRAIEAVAQTVSSEAAFSSMRTKVLNVTNAFHSTLVDPLMTDLQRTAEGLEFSDSVIRLERATEFHSEEKLSPKYVAEHMRFPVYLDHAVQRLAKEYPSAIWLEAGSNSTITTMISRALSSPADAYFQSISITNTQSAFLNLSDATANLWKAGLTVSFWAHHVSQTYKYPLLMLPPYQFDRARHWIEIKSPPKAIENKVIMQKDVSAAEELPKGLLTFTGYQDGQQRLARFRINTMIPKYEELVNGHVIAETAAICPATVEVDLVIEAIHSLRPDLSESDLQPQIHAVDNQAPICINPSRSVWLDLEAIDAAQSPTWNFKIISTGSGKSTATTVHVTGKLIFRSVKDLQVQLEFARYERLVAHSRCQALLNSADADDIIQGRNIYKTFAEIVNYGEMYRGLQKLVGHGNMSAGRVVKKYSDETWLDAHLSDCFSQVGGIWVNCMTNRAPTDMYIANGFEQWVRSPKLKDSDTRPEVWDVLAQHLPASDKAFTTDIFIFDAATGSLMEVIMGINYAKVAKMSMSKLLSRLTVTGDGTDAPALASVPVKMPSVPVTTATTAPSGHTHKSPHQPKAPKPQKKKRSSQPDVSGKVRAMLAELSGLELEEITDDVELANIGIDSLMGMELAREIEVIFKCSLPADDLVEVTDFKSLLQCIQSALGPSREEEVEEEDEDQISDEDESNVSEAPNVFTPSDMATSVTSTGRADVTEYLADFLGIEEGEISPSTLLRDMGVDSLLSTELRSDIAAKFDVHISEDVPIEELTVEEFDIKINESSGASSKSAKAGINPPPPVNNSIAPVSGTLPSSNADLNLPVSVVLEAWGETKSLTDQFIVDYQCGNYMGVVLPKQDQLCVALAVEAFEQLGCPLKTAKPGEKLRRINNLPQHDRLAEYLYIMLDKGARLIDVDAAGQITRTSVLPPAKSSSDFCKQLNRDFPEHHLATNLTYFCGTRLAEVLLGKLDGIKLIFGSPEGRELVSGLYGDSLLNKLAYKQMEDFLKRLSSKLSRDGAPLKILEMGAGTGGTTKWIVPALASLNIPVEYTFTDLAPSFVAAARQKFKAYPFMKFKVHDIEKEPAADLIGTQHIVLASNAVHATHSLTESCKNIRKALRPDGLLMMLEMTETAYFVDVIFGLLEGWWLFDDGRKHAIAHQTRWEKDLQSSGFGHVDYTDGHRPEVNIQRIFIALASGQRYDRLSIPPKPAAEKSLTDCVAREAAADKYLRKAVQEFTVSPARIVFPPVLTDQCVLLTGATGSLGSHLVAHLAQLSTVTTIFCINRVSSGDATARQYQAFTSKGILLSAQELSKIEVYETDTAKPMLGLPQDQYARLIRTVTHVVHNAWPMSGKRALIGFDSQFRVMRNLIDLANEASSQQERKIGFQFISSISVVGHYPLINGGNPNVPEVRVNIDSVLPNGYSEAKLVCERMLDETLHQHPSRFRPMSVRLGQVAGSKSSGYWNPMEHFSFLIKSAQTLKAFPALTGKLSWTSVNDVAGTLSDLLVKGDHDPYPIYHIDNPIRQSWEEMIPVLVEALDIPPRNVIPFEEWVTRVRRFPGSAETDNPAARLIDFLDDNFLRMSCGGLLLDTKRSCEHSEGTMAAVGPISAETARRYIVAWKEMEFLR